jgi:hypothetical protein
VPRSPAGDIPLRIEETWLTSSTVPERSWIVDTIWAAM